MITKALKNLHNYFEERKNLKVVTCKSKHSNILNSSTLFSPKLEDEKLHMTCRNGKHDEGSVVLLASSAWICFTKLCFSPPRESAETNFDKSLQILSKARPASCWVAFLHRQKSHLEELEHSLNGLTHGTDFIVERDDW